LDISSDGHDSQANRPGALLALVQTVRAMAGWLIGFFALTDAERLYGGIYLGGMERDQ
jgi:hypothetical protein